LRASYDRIRDLGGRLLHAQDAERAHIARELHDDVSQQLALIEMDLKLLGSAERPDTDLAAETVDRVQGVARSLRDLSHRLHPAKLRLIGLVVALKGLQGEMQQSGLDITFTNRAVPPSLPQAVTLALFRVAQEALQNARKYSGARHVSIEVAGEGEQLHLRIEDDGVGFDVTQAWGSGLGLVSMMERVEGISGRFDIRSVPGVGTRIDVTVPLAREQSGSLAV